MAWLNFWKTDEKTEKSDYLEDSEREKINSLKRQDAELRRERARIDLENYRLKQEIEKQRLQLELDRIQQEREELLANDDDDDIPQNPDDMFSKMMQMMMLQYMQKQAPPQPQNNTFTQQPTPQEPTMTIEQAREQFNSLPPMVQAQAKKMSDDDLRRWCISNIPNIDAQSVNNVLQVVKNG